VSGGVTPVGHSGVDGLQVLGVAGRPARSGWLMAAARALSVGHATVVVVNVAEGVVSESLAALGCDAPHRVLRTLTAGGSGAWVFLLELPTGRAVLKVTEDPAWLRRARRELGVYRELAGRLGVAVPAVMAAHSDRGVIRLLLAEHTPYPPAPAVTDPEWTALADQLGRLHRPPDATPPWLEHRLWPASDQLAQAVAWWTARGFGALARRATELIAVGHELDETLPRVITHGDCHVGNLLRSDLGDTVWVDWQEVCLSSGFLDLAFLWQRAEFAGAIPPREAMWEVYLTTRGLRPDLDLRSLIAVAELLLLVVDWPSFLHYGSRHQQQLMTHRLGQLVDELTGS